jgi:tungstate transport system substrate-binding protein
MFGSAHLVFFRRMFVALSLALCLGAVPMAARSAERYIVVASTTSTENTGLFEHILPRFTKVSGTGVRVVAVGTGQAIRLARNGDADILLVHHRASEEKFVAEGFGVERHNLMYNDFVIVGPKADPAKVRGLSSASQGLGRIANRGAAFVSRSDKSGTHKAEMELWRAAQIDPTAASGGWYRETGSGMGAALNIAAGADAYALTDRGTWVSFGNKSDLEILIEGDKRLFNQYGVIAVNAVKHPHVKAAEGEAFVSWLLSSQGQAAIADFRLGGQQLFFPNARSAVD